MNTAPADSIPTIPFTRNPDRKREADMHTITPEQWRSLSERLDLSLPTLKAVAEVESAGSGFLIDGRAKILFEGHVFSRLTKRAYDAKHPTLSHKKWTRKHYLGGGAEWTRLEAARALDFDAANQSASWGAFQIMGFNHRACGFLTVSAFVQAMALDAASQLDAFAAFVAREPFLTALRAQDWARFARAYNGSGYAQNQYDQKLAAAFQKHGEKTLAFKTNNDTPIGRSDPPRPAKRARHKDVRPDPVDLRDFVYRPPVGTRPPPELLPKAARIRNQGDTYACTGFALAAVIERLLLRADPAKADAVSPWMLYALARRYDEFNDDPNDDLGSSLRGALKAWSRHGASRESLWPKLREPKRTKQQQAAVDWWNEAVSRPLGAYYRVDTAQIIDLQHAIVEAGVVYASVFTHPGWSKLDRARATPMPVQASGFPAIELVKSREQSGHAIALVGYTEAGFIIQNSYGPRFGAGGYALLRYGDWITNAMDAWVVQLGVVTAERRAIAQRDGLRMRAGDVLLSGERHLQTHELSSYVINFGNNGQLSPRGHFSTHEDDLRELCEILIPRARADFGLAAGDPLPIALFAHGGLVGERSAETSARDWIPHLYERGIFPIYIAWETGLFNTLLGSIADKFRDDDEPAPTAAIARSKKLRRNWLIEKFARHIIGRSSWREMKENAELIATTKYRRRDGAAIGLAALWRAMHAARQAQPQVYANTSLHLIGHSAGTVMMRALLDRVLPALGANGKPLAANGLSAAHPNEWHPPLASFSAIAAALRSDRFWPTLPDWQARGLDPKRILLAHLTQGAEHNDKAGPYKGSLLYLIARAFEDDDPTPLLGLAECSEPELALRGLPIQSITSPTSLPNGTSTAATSHGALDNDRVVMERVVGNVRG